MGELALNDRPAFDRKVAQPKAMNLLDGLDSTLSIMKVQGTPRLRVIFTLDDDPLFSRTLFTLLRVIDHDRIDRTYQQIAESLYRGLLEVKVTKGG